MRAIAPILVFLLLIGGCRATGDDDDSIEPVTPEDEVVEENSVVRTMTCGASGWSHSVESFEPYYQAFSCVGSSNIADPVYIAIQGDGDDDDSTPVGDDDDSAGDDDDSAGDDDDSAGDDDDSTPVGDDDDSTSTNPHVWASDGATDGTFTVYSNPMYGLITAAPAPPLPGSN